MLVEARRKKKELHLEGHSTAGVDAEIRSLHFQIREGGQDEVTSQPACSIPDAEHLEGVRKSEAARAVEEHLDPIPRFSRIAHFWPHPGTQRFAAFGFLVTAISLVSMFQWFQSDAVGDMFVNIAKGNANKKLFHRECVHFDAPLTDVNVVSPGVANRRMAAGAACDDAQITDIVDKLGGPLFVLGEPGAGKRFAMFKIQNRVTERGVPSVFVTAKDCVPFIRSGKTLRECIDAKVAKSIEHYLPSSIEQRERAAVEFLGRKDWWLFIDGIDDVGDSMQSGAALRELNELHQWHGAKIAVSGKGETIAYAMYLIPNGEAIREVFTRFSRVFVYGLREDGSAEMQARVVREAAPGRQVELKRRFASLNSLRSCAGDSGSLAAEILRRPSFMLDVDRSQEFPGVDSCGPDACDALAGWVFDIQFDSYCTDICGDGNRRSELQLAASECFGELRRHPVASISRASMVDMLSRSTMRDGVDDVIRALLGAGVLTAAGSGSFHVRTERICAESVR
ncbi:hypothetical protein [Sorangium sp. So ce388]|uniref:hypothetical protein n=1 Tax=Sorangium sp. So ce388 TaxID=3133309 RepID=UPI003F5CA3C2